jgi:hypothetical protein
MLTARRVYERGRARGEERERREGRESTASKTRTVNRRLRAEREWMILPYNEKVRGRDEGWTEKRKMEINDGVRFR